MGSGKLPGRYSKRAASKNIDELILLALIIGVLILIAACMGFAGSLLLLALVAVFLGIVSAVFNCQTLSLMHVALLLFIIFSVFTGAPLTAIVVTGGAAYLVLYAVAGLLEQIQYDRYSLR